MSRTNCPRDGDAFGAILLDIEEVDALTLYRDWAKEMQDAFSAGTDGRCARRRPPDIQLEGRHLTLTRAAGA